MIADMLRCNMLPDCYMAPAEFRERRRTLRYRNLLVRQSVQMKNRIAGMLMETGVVYNKQKLHQKRYFAQLRDSAAVPECIQPLLKVGRETVEQVDRTGRALMRTLQRDTVLKARLERLLTIPGIGPVTALTWVLEVGEVSRFSSIADAVSYCGLCSAERSSAGVPKRSPISKQRNKHLQTVLIEAAKLAPRWNSNLALLHEKALQKGNRNRATIAVARKLVAYLLAVDRREKPFLEGVESADAA
jgi:transposase